MNVGNDYYTTSVKTYYKFNETDNIFSLFHYSTLTDRAACSYKNINNTFVVIISQ